MVKIDGLDELARFLATAPQEIRTEAMTYVREETEGAAVEIAARYGFHTGKLRGSVKTSYPSEDVLIGVAQATAPHSHLVEWGTRARQTRGGANRGRMPGIDPSQNVAAIAQRRRGRLARRLREMLTRMGFEVGA